MGRLICLFRTIDSAILQKKNSSVLLAMTDSKVGKLNNPGLA